MPHDEPAEEDMMKQSGNYIFVLGDGDRVRERIESHLLNGEFDALKEISQKLIDSINEMRSLAISTMDAEIIMAGGDDILFRIRKERYDKANVQKLATSFEQSTGISFSFGIGEDLKSAYINLRRAKASKGDKIINGDIK